MEIKDSEIYPSYTFRLSQEEKTWLDNELVLLKAKFNEDGKGKLPVITKNILIMAALKRGLGFLKGRERLDDLCIEREVMIQATAENVWDALTNSTRLGEWWQKGMKLEPFANGEFIEPWEDANGNAQLATGKVKAVIPKKFIEFFWSEKSWEPDQRTICSFELSAIQEKTSLKVIHRGWDRFPPERASVLKSGFEAGWDALLDNLKKFLS